MHNHRPKITGMPLPQGNERWHRDEAGRPICRAIKCGNAQPATQLRRGYVLEDVHREKCTVYVVLPKSRNGKDVQGMEGRANRI